jgi:hypothetical protein
MRKNKPARRTELQATIDTVIARLRSAQNPVSALSAVRRTLQPGQFAPVISALQSNAYLRRQLFNAPTPDSARQIKRHKVLSPIDEALEIRWAAAYLRLFGDELDAFITYSNQFQREYLTGKLINAEQTLSTIESKVGSSLWSIKRRIALLQATRGLESQKRYVAEIRRESLKEGIAAFIAYLTSIKHEESSTARGLEAFCEHYLTVSSIPSDLKAYLRYHVLSGSSGRTRDIASVLLHENAGTVVDYYQAFLFVTRLVASSGTSHLRQAALSAVRSLRVKVSDPRLAVLELELGGEPISSVLQASSADAPVELLLAGDYDGAVKSGLRALAKSPEDPDLLCVTARAMASMDDVDSYLVKESGGLPRLSESIGAHESVASQVLAQLACVLRDGSESDATEPLKKTASGAMGEPWADAVLGAIAAEASPNPLVMQELDHRYSVSAIPTLSPLRVVALSEHSVRRAYLESLEATLTSSANRIARAWSTASSDSAIIEGDDSLAPNERSLVSANLAYSIGDWLSALDHSQVLATTKTNYFRRHGLRIQCASLLRLGRLSDAALISSKALARDWALYHVLPIRELADGLSKGVDAELSSSLAPTIIFDIFNTFLGNEYDSHLEFAFEDFLMANNLERPSEVRSKASTLDEKELVFFLNFVCVVRVMDRMVNVFTSSRDVLEERVAICRLLLELDSEYAELYQSEILALLGSLLVRRRLREVEDSKIYVDRDGVAKAAESRIRESFRRFQALARIDLPSLRVANVTISLGSPDIQLGLSIPQVESESLLISMIETIRDEYVSNSSYGLDGFLSTRIRHGTLVNQLRSGLEEVHLITPRDSTTKLYIRDEYWTEHLGDVDALAENAVAERLARFSEEFDNLVSVIRTEWIQVKKLEPDKGWFNFIIGETFLDRIHSVVTADSTPGDLIAQTLLTLDELLDTNMARIRQALTLLCSQEIEAMLSSLQQDLMTMPVAFDRSELANAIAAARTKVQLSFDRVVSWFQQSAAQAYEAFTLRDAIKVAEASLPLVGKSMDLEVQDEDCADILFKGRLLPHIVDVFFILFENVLSKDGLGAKRRVTVTVNRDDDFIHADVRNSVRVGTRTKEIERRLQQIRDGLADGRYLGLSTTEGGSGLSKVGKIVAHDASQPPMLRFGFEDDSTFAVNVGFSIGLLEGTAHDPGAT